MSNAAAAAPQPQLLARHVFAAVIGNALEFYDFVTYSFFSIQIGHAFFHTKTPFGSLMLSLAIFGVGFITRPIGAVVIGGFSDRVGRRSAMMLSFTMMGAAILTMACIPTYAQIGIFAPILAITARMVMGFSLGGEVGPNTAYLLEAAAPNRRGLIVSWQGASQGLAATAGGLVGVVLSLLMSPASLDAYGWRIAFLIGGAALPFGLLLRRTMPETLQAKETDTVAAVAEAGGEPAARGALRTAILGVMVLGGGTIGTYVANYMTTFAQSSLHMSSTVSFLATVLPNLTGVIAVLLGGWLSDRIGRRPIMIWPNVINLLATLPVFFWINATHSVFALLGGLSLLGFIGTIGVGAFYASLGENLPKRVRGQSFATIYAGSIAVFGGTTQLVITWLIHLTGSNLAPGVYLTVANIVALTGMWLIIESAPARMAGPQRLKPRR